MRNMKTTVFNCDEKMEIRGVFCIPNTIRSLKPPQEIMAEIARDTFEPAILEPTRVLDDVFYIGTEIVGTTVVKTTEGLVLIDAMSCEADLENVIEPGLRKLGLDPADIKLVILTHAHYDHYGTARIIKEKYGAKLCMSEVDTDFLMTGPHIPINIPQGPAAGITIDFYLEDRKDIVMGDKTFKLYFTPGHSPGTMSLIYNGTFRGKTYMVGNWGGTAISVDPVAIQQYIDSIGMFIDECDKENVEVSLQTHACVDYSLYKGYYDGYLNNLDDNEPNPMILGKERFLYMLNCIRFAAIGQLEVIKADEWTAKKRG